MHKEMADLAMDTSYWKRLVRKTENPRAWPELCHGEAWGQLVSNGAMIDLNLKS